MPNVTVISSKLNPSTGENIIAIPVTQWSAPGATPVTLNSGNEATYLGGLFNKDTSPGGTGQYFKWQTSGAYPVSRLTSLTQSNLQKLINDFGTASATLLVDRVIPITSNVTIPTNIKVEFIDGAYFATSVPTAPSITPIVYVDIQSSRNVNIEQFGAIGDGKFYEGIGSINSGSTSLTVSTGVFSSKDVGKAIAVIGAAATSQTLVTTISAYVSPTQVTLANVASTTVSGSRVTFGTDNTAAFRRFNSWAKSIPGLITLNFQKAKVYLLKSCRWTFNIENLVVNGNGCFIRNISFTSFDRSSFITCAATSKTTTDGQPAVKVDFYRINTVQAGATEVFTTVIGNAANMVVGEWIMVSSEDILLSGTPPNFRYFDYVKVSAIDTVLGKITLDRSLKYTHRVDALHNTVSDATNGYTGQAAIYRIEQGSKFGINHVYNDINFFCETSSGAGADYVIMSGWNVTFNGCSARYWDPTAAENVQTINCTDQQSEFDKLVTNFVDNGSTWNLLNGGAGVTNMTFNNSRFIDVIGLTPRNLVMNNCTQKGTGFSVGVRAGGTDRFTINGGIFNVRPAISINFSQVRKVQLGVGGIAYSSGILTIPTVSGVNINFLGALYVGRRIEVIEADSTGIARGTNNYGEVTAYSCNGTNTSISIVFSGTISGSEYICIFDEPAFTKIENTVISAELVKSKAYTEIGDYISLQDIFKGLNINTAFSNTLRIKGGSAKKIIVDVKKAFTGTTLNPTLEITGVFPTGTTAQPILIDLSKVGRREISDTYKIGFLSSPDSASNNLNLSKDYYKSSYRVRTTVTLAGSLNSELPIVDIYIENYINPLQAGSPNTLFNVQSASLSQRGTVLLGSQVADSATDAGGAYSQSQVQSILTELRNLKNSLISAGIISPNNS